MTTKTKTSAEQVYERCTESVELLLSDIGFMVARHGICGGHINWCHVGDMAHIEAKLSEIKQFLQGGE